MLLPDRMTTGRSADRPRSISACARRRARSSAVAVGQALARRRRRRARRGTCGRARGRPSLEAVRSASADTARAGAATARRPAARVPATRSPSGAQHPRRSRASLEGRRHVSLRLARSALAERRAARQPGRRAAAPAATARRARGGSSDAVEHRRQADAIGVEQRPAAPRREAVAVDVDDVDVRGARARRLPRARARLR